MRVVVENATCDGYGTCNAHLPDVFKLDEWGYAFLEGDGEVPAGMEDLARRAAIDCPVHAIRVIEE